MIVSTAPRYTRILPSSNAVAVANGDSIRVYGIFVNGTSATFFEKDGITIITTIKYNGTPFELRTGFIADQGLKVTTNAATEVLVLHSNTGA